MYYKQFGTTNLKVSAVGMGTMRYNDDDINAGNLGKCADVVLYAHEKGINYFDSAPFYCQDKSEIITGMALSQLKRDSFFITSKVNLGTLDNKTTADDFKRRLENSLKRLKVDYLDFYYLWCMLDLESFKKQNDLLYKHFEQAKKDGLIRNIAVSSHMQGPDLEKEIGRAHV